MAIRKVTALYSGVAGSPYYVTGYFNQAVGSAQDCADDWLEFLCGSTGTGLPTGATVTCGSEVQVLQESDGELIGTEPLSPVTYSGSATGQLLPPATQLMVRWTTDVIQGGRRIRGRTFIPLQFEDENSAAGNVASTYITARQGLANSLLGSAASEFVIWSRKNGSKSVVNGANISPYWSVLKSRKVT